MTETVEKLSRIRKYLKAHNLDGAVFMTRANFAWLSGGGDSHVASQLENGVGALVVTAKLAWVVANKIEIDRLHTEEQLAAFTPKSFPWIQPFAEGLEKLLPEGAFVCDIPLGKLKPLPADFLYECRAQLTESEIRRYKALGRDCSLVMETVARQLTIGDSEHQAEGDMARHLLARSIQPYVLLVAFDDRIKRYRHPTPTANHLRKIGMLVICGQRGGLIACLTRLIHFGALPADLINRHEACLRVDGALWAATKIGVSYGEVLQAGIDQYKKEGFAKEWELHHQGGPCGYAGRDFFAVPGESRVVLDKQAVAWNPSITGTKSEDTFIMDGAQRLVLTAASAEWPTSKVTIAGESFLRPQILVR
jgi:Xaa-Pro aminopeptidase